MKLSDQLKQRRASIAEGSEDKRQKASAIYTKAQAEKRQPTNEEIQSFDAIMVEVEASAGEIKKLDRQIEAAETHETSLKDTVRRTEGAPVGDVDAGARRDQPRSIYRPFAEVRSPGRPKNFKAENLVQAQEDAYRSGMWCRAVIFGDVKAKAWCEEHGVPMVRDAYQSEGSNTTGGVLVPAEFEQAIIDLREVYGVFRQWAQPKTMASDTSIRPRRTGGLTAYAIGENSALTESNKTWDSVALTARKWGVLTRWSNELNVDAVISIADDLSQEIAYAFAVSEDDAGLNGDGSSTYNGIVGVRSRLIPSVGLAGAVDAATGHDTFAEIDADDLDLIIAKLPQYARMNAKFYCSSVAKALVFDPITRAAGGNNRVDVAGKPMDAYQGYPIVISQKMPTAVTDISDTAMILFGDLAMAVSFGTRGGISVAVDASRYFEYDQLAIRGTERFDINVHDLGTSTAAGPLVALVGE